METNVRLNSEEQLFTNNKVDDKQQKHPSTIFSTYMAEKQTGLLLDKTMPLGNNSTAPKHL